MSIFSLEPVNSTLHYNLLARLIESYWLLNVPLDSIFLTSSSENHRAHTTRTSLSHPDDVFLLSVKASGGLALNGSLIFLISASKELLNGLMGNASVILHTDCCYFTKGSHFVCLCFLKFCSNETSFSLQRWVSGESITCHFQHNGED